MPYVRQVIRKKLDDPLEPTEISGELSYRICREIKRFMKAHPNGGWEGMIAPVFGALEGARIAFNEEVALPYERKKREANGDIFS